MINSTEKKLYFVIGEGLIENGSDYGISHNLDINDIQKILEAVLEYYSLGNIERKEITFNSKFALMYEAKFSSCEVLFQHLEQSHLVYVYTEEELFKNFGIYFNDFYISISQ